MTLFLFPWTSRERLEEREAGHEYGASGNLVGIISWKKVGSMSQAINCGKVIVLIVVIVMSYSCLLHPIIGPGYTLTVAVDDAALHKLGDIDFLDTVALREGFSQKRVAALSAKWECIHYVKKLDGPQFQILQQYKFVNLYWCYDFEESTDGINRPVKNLRLGIDNDWGGQESLIKQEIDRLGSVFYQELVSRFNSNNVRLERGRSGPPF